MILCVVCPMLVIWTAPVPPFGSVAPQDTCSNGSAVQTGFVQSSLHSSRLSKGSKNVKAVNFPSTASNNVSSDAHSASDRFEYSRRQFTLPAPESLIRIVSPEGNRFETVRNDVCLTVGNCETAPVLSCG